MPSLAGMLATSPVPQARSMNPNRPTRRTPLRDRNERRVNEKSENTEYARRLLADRHCRLDANHGVTGSWLRFLVSSVRSWRTPWD